MVYFAQATGGGPIKIGYCADGTLGQRLGALQSACPFELTVTRTIDGATRADERALHLRFRLARMRGEWFYPTEDVALEAHALGEDALVRNTVDAYNALAIEGTAP